jgi:hypothetical protein
MTRAAKKRSGLQVEDEENDPDKLAVEAVVAIFKVPLTSASVPDAEPVKLKDADPEPPATALSSASVSSIMISIFSLLADRWLMSARTTSRRKCSALQSSQHSFSHRGPCIQ